jgi:nicotinate phosphoribosyltransferase
MLELTKDNYRKYVDKYFLRTKEILQKEGLNPIVKYQVFCREQWVKALGIKEAIDIITKFAPKAEVWAVDDGDRLLSKDTMMTITAPVQEIVDLETLYLGVLARAITSKGETKHVDLKSVYEKMSRIVDLIEGRDIIYMGARHWHYEEDAEIAGACFKAGVKYCSTDIGGEKNGTEGVGTIPHALECIMHWKYGIDKAVFKATKAFDDNISSCVPRIALIDYANKEIEDAISVVEKIKSLYGIRIDTCGENWMQDVPHVKADKYYLNSGVCVWGVKCLVDEMHFLYGDNCPKVILSSGFGDYDKVKAYVEYEKQIGYRLFDSLGIGAIYDCTITTADIVEIDGKEIHKVGRPFRPNPALRRVV